MYLYPSTSVSDSAILRVFKSVLISKYRCQNDSSKFYEIQLNLLKHGILFDTQIYETRNIDEVTVIAEKAIKAYGANFTKLNSTFWKRFSDVENRSEFELRLNQWVHYMTTYGQDNVGKTAWSAKVYIPNKAERIGPSVLQEITYISGITRDELIAKIKTMLTSGIALKQETIDDLLNIIDTLHIKIDYLDEIKNREFMCIICERLGLVPKNFDEFARYINYLLTGSTMLVLKQKDNVYNWKFHWPYDAKCHAISRSIQVYVQKFGIKQLGANIRRYYKLFEVIHSSTSDPELRHIINRAFKLAKKAHIRRRRQMPALDHVMDRSVSLAQIKKSATNVPIFKLFKVINAVRNIDASESKSKLYRIRNGKSYLKILDRNKQIENLMLNEIKNRLGDWSDKLFYLPREIKYAMPTSEKTFVGTLPYLTSYNYFGQDIVAGVAWKKECDLDLHASLLDGTALGWNSDYKTTGAVFSGDMTHTNQYHYAAEFFKFSHGLKEPALLRVHNYWDGDNAKIDIFVGAQSPDLKDPNGVVTQLQANSVLAKDKMDERVKTLVVVKPVDKGFTVIYTGFNYGGVRIPESNDSSKALTSILTSQVANAFSVEELVHLLGGSVTHSKDKFEEQKATFSVNDIKPSLSEQYVSLDDASVKEFKEFIDLSPAKVTPSTFIDLLKESEN